MAFRNFLRSNRWKGFKNAFGRHSNRVAQQDFNATIIDYIGELEAQIEELHAIIDNFTGRPAAIRRRNTDRFNAYQNGPATSRAGFSWDEPDDVIMDDHELVHDDDDDDAHPLSVPVREVKR